jgi:hypothetical protein
LLINCIHLENLLHIPESIEKVTASQGRLWGTRQKYPDQGGF